MAALLLDETITAKQAVESGFANDYLDMSKFDVNKDWFDPDAVPAIKKLLSTDYATLVNGMNLINLAKD